MKLSEVIEALERNPKKRFKSINRIGDIESVLEISFDGYLYLERKNIDGTKLPVGKPSGGFNGNINIYADWQEVKQPVPWQEAIEAWVNGKTIKCTMQGSDFIFDGYKPKLRDQIDTICRAQLTHGTWYIED